MKGHQSVRWQPRGNLCEVEEEEGGATDSEVEKGRWVRTLEHWSNYPGTFQFSSLHENNAENCKHCLILYNSQELAGSGALNLQQAGHNGPK